MNKEALYIVLEVENIIGIVVADKDGVIKSVSRTNGGLSSDLISAKWYNAFSIPVEKIDTVEEINPEIFRLHESGRNFLYYPEL